MLKVNVANDLKLWRGAQMCVVKSTWFSHIKLFRKRQYHENKKKLHRPCTHTFTCLWSGRKNIGDPKMRNIYCARNWWFFQYCESNFGLFSIASCNVCHLIFFTSFLVFVLCFFLFLSRGSALPTIAIKSNIAITIV